VITTKRENNIQQTRLEIIEAVNINHYLMDDKRNVEIRKAR